MAEPHTRKIGTEAEAERRYAKPSPGTRGRNGYWLRLAEPLSCSRLVHDDDWIPSERPQSSSYRRAKKRYRDSSVFHDGREPCFALRGKRTL
jgi:hypothetical protein